MYWIILILGVLILGFMIFIGLPTIWANGDGNLLITAGPTLVGIILVWSGARGIKKNKK